MIDILIAIGFLVVLALYVIGFTDKKKEPSKKKEFSAGQTKGQTK